MRHTCRARGGPEENLGVECLGLGNVAGLDGHGLVLSTHSEHSVVRLESIIAVRIPENAPNAPTAEAFDDHHELTVAVVDEDAWAMPGPVNA